MIKESVKILSFEILRPFIIVFSISKIVYLAGVNILAFQPAKAWGKISKIQDSWGTIFPNVTYNLIFALISNVFVLRWGKILVVGWGKILILWKNI